MASRQTSNLIGIKHFTPDVVELRGAGRSVAHDAVGQCDDGAPPSMKIIEAVLGSEAIPLHPEIRVLR
jgi:hypothetical protein